MTSTHPLFPWEQKIVDRHRNMVARELQNCRDTVSRRAQLVAEQAEKIQAEKTAALEAALIAECERAMAQRDEFLKTGKSTAGHGGSHDTLFGFILRQHGVKF